MARCQCGGGGCDCVVIAGTNATVVGGGSSANPYVVSSQVPCADVRNCLSAASGVSFDKTTGSFAASLSAQAGNNLVVASDGGLFVPTGAATITAGCGLTGSGAASSPVKVNVPAWPFPCDAATNGQPITCDSNGVLRGAPGYATYFDQYSLTKDYTTNPVVPSASDSVAETFTWSYTNPDPCRSVTVFLEREADVDFDLPAGASAAAGQDTDEMSYFKNTGSTTLLDFHIQSTKVYRHQTSLAPGTTASVSFPVTVGRGSGGATYNRIQIFLRAMMHTL